MNSAEPTTLVNISGIKISMKGRIEIMFHVIDKIPVKQQKIASITKVILCRLFSGESVSKTQILSKKFLNL